MEATIDSLLAGFSHGMSGVNHILILKKERISVADSGAACYTGIEMNMFTGQKNIL